MLKILQDFEAASSHYDAAILVWLGLILVAAGLFVWLGGLGLKRILAAVIGAIIGGICGFLINSNSIAVAGVSVVIGAVTAGFFSKIFITLAGVFLITALGIIILTGVTNKSAQAHTSVKSSEMLNMSQTIESVKQYAEDLAAKAKKTCLELPPYQWAIIIISATIFLIAAIFVSSLTSALCCAAMGSILIFSGMMLLLLYKGSNPISQIIDKQSYYGTVLAAMTGFGMVSQLIFCHHPEKKLKIKKVTGKDKES